MEKARAQDEFDGGIIILGEIFFDRALVVANDEKEAALIASANLVASLDGDPTSTPFPPIADTEDDEGNA